MSENEVKAFEVGLQNVNEGLRRLEKLIEKNREETRQDINRIHERLDDQKAVIARDDCERYRKECTAAQDKKIEKAKGVPYWVTGLISLCVGLIVFVITKG